MIVKRLECEQQQERTVFSENSMLVYDSFHNLSFEFLKIIHYLSLKYKG
jgi:hypothetical protein